jgi:hypothetical protein
VEIWKDIKDFEGCYQVSNLGRIKSLNRVVKFGKQNRLVVEKIIKQHINKNGYLNVVLYKPDTNHKAFNKMVHRLVSETFIKNEENKFTINHKNGNKLDNRVYNLEWYTPHEQMLHATYTLNKIKTKKVKCIEYQMIFESSFKAAEWLNNKHFANKKKINILAQCIRAVARGKRKICYKYRWKYIN